MTFATETSLGLRVMAVEPLVVIMIQAAAIFLQRFRQRRTGIFLPVLHQVFRVAAKVSLKPNVDARHLQPILLYRYPARVVDKFTGALFQQLVRILSRIGDRLQIRTSQARTIDRIVDPVVLPDWPENTVLDVVERKLLPFDGQQLGAPRPALE